MKYVRQFYTVGVCSLLALGTSIARGQSVDIPRDDWKIARVDSFQKTGPPEMAIDGNPQTHWHTKYSGSSGDPLPHEIEIDMGQEYTVNGFRYLPRPDGGNGNIADYEFYVSNNGKNWGKPVSSGTFVNRRTDNTITFPEVPRVRFVKLKALSGFNKNPNFAAAAEIHVLQASKERPEPRFYTPTTVVRAGRSLRFEDRSTVSPQSWEWTFPGGTPSKSTEQNPVVTYQKPGFYDVSLKVTNANGSRQQTFRKKIIVSNLVTNMALYLDGKDNDVRTGLPLLENEWTLEAWIKGNDKQWNAEEVIFGAGEYSDVKDADTRVLTVRHGKLTSSQAKISSDEQLDDQWHHVAVSCDGHSTRLYLDGQEIDKAERRVVALPSCIGVDRENSTFGGSIDEVRVWKTALSEELLRAWMNKPIEASHPYYTDLLGYYPFDDMSEETSANWVGRGHQAYHLRNGRIDYKGDAPLAYPIFNDNQKFASGNKQPQRLFNAVVIATEWDAEQGIADQQHLKLRIAVHGAKNPLKLQELQLDLSQCDSLKDIEKIHVYQTGGSARSTQKIELFGRGQNPAKQLILKAPQHAGKEYLLRPGINYFLVTLDLAQQAEPGHLLKLSIPSFTCNGRSYTPETVSDNQVVSCVSPNRENDPDIVKVLQWNIWHGGVHLAETGRQAIVDLIRVSRADIITMQEAYGFQDELAKELGYHLQTKSSRDNLALYSRFSMKPIKTSKPFQSNPVFLTIDNGRKILVNDVWLRYSYRPEYTVAYMCDGMNPADWIREDARLATQDASYILEEDVLPHLKSKDMPVIIGGDFNSGSHLDWTAAAAKFHNGYGPVELPCSLYMQKQGFIDSFRDANPDEVQRPEGTFAVIYGHLQHSRIDFIYHRGKGIQTVSSKIVRSHPEIDYVWPSDHAAVLTTFRIASPQAAQSDN